MISDSKWHFSWFDKYFLFILLDKLLQNDLDDLQIISIELPRKTSLFVVASDDSISELKQFNEKHRSFFVGEVVCSNGKVYMSTTVDPLFIFIQYLERSCKERAEPLEQILEGPAQVFSKVLSLSQMKLVADQKGPDNLKAFKFNNKKTLQWLKKKLKQTQKVLIDLKISTSATSSMNFVKSSLDDAVDESAIKEIALGILSEYISLDLKEQLKTSIGLITDEVAKDPTNNKRKSDLKHSNDNLKKVKVEDQDDYKSPSPPKPSIAQLKQTTKAKALEKAAKGSKSINSFFTKK